MYALVAACGLECIEARNIQFVDFCPPDKARESGILSKITCTVWLPDQLVSGLKVSPYIYLQKTDDIKPTAQRITEDFHACYTQKAA